MAAALVGTWAKVMMMHAVHVPTGIASLASQLLQHTHAVPEATAIWAVD